MIVNFILKYCFILFLGSFFFNVDKVLKLSFKLGNDDGVFKIEKVLINWIIRINGLLDYEIVCFYVIMYDYNYYSNLIRY